MAFRIPTRTTLRAGCFAELAAASASLPGNRRTLVLDGGLQATPWVERAVSQLCDAGFMVEVFSEVEANPRAATIERLAEELRQAGSEAVIGLGGGSVLDAAKAAAMLATNAGSCEDFEGRNRFSAAPLPFLAVPTTCGTGSEVTWVSVISVPERRAKISVKGDGMFPTLALVDADLLTTLPSQLVAWTGLDALTHALEAYTGRLANPASDALAEGAIRRLCAYLPRAVSDIAGDATAREAVMTASTLAGMAFGNADVGAVHCLSETLGGRYDVPHGLANAILLGPVLRAHGEAVEGRLAALAPAVLGRGAGSQAAEEVLAALAGLVEAVGTPPFRSLAVPAEDLPEIAAAASRNGSNGSNPRPMGESEYLEILRGLA